MHALFGDLAHLAQGPNLKAPRVGQDGLLPFFKTMQATKTGHDVQTRAHPQMESVAQNNLRSHFFQAARHHTFDRAISAYGHEDGGFNHTMVECELASSRVAVGVCFEKLKFKHAWILCIGRGGNASALQQHGIAITEKTILL